MGQGSETSEVRERWENGRTVPSALLFDLRRSNGYTSRNSCRVGRVESPV